MPRKRWRAKRRRELTWEQELELFLGPRSAGQSAYASEAERREAWGTHREQFMEHTRPWAWWKYDAPASVRPAWHQGIAEEWAALEAAGLATEDERVSLALHRKQQADLARLRATWAHPTPAGTV
jgi:hypothetical protein